MLDVDGVDNTIGTADDEDCDDGNNINADGCNSLCKDEYCGDGIINDNEECDL